MEGVFRGEPFALEEAAGDLESWIEPFIIIYDEGEEIGAFTGLFRGRGRGQDQSIS